MNAKVVVIGPSSARYKGGIALFATRLSEALAEFCAVEFKTWNRMYPTSSRMLPGAVISSDPSQLDFLCPSTWRNAAREIAELSPAAILINWVHPIHTPVFRRLLSNLREFPVWVICHNVAPHEPLPGMIAVTQWALKDCTGIVVHAESAEIQARAMFPGKPLVRLFLPPLEIPPQILEPAPGDTGLGQNPEAPARFIFFGHLRPYKGLETLLDAFALLKKELPHVTLTIAGEPFTGSPVPGASKRYLGRLREKIVELALSSDVELIAEYLPDEKLSDLLMQSHVAVFPFLSVTPSASVVTALEYGLPVIVSRFPGVMEFVKVGINGRFADPGDPQSLAESMRELSMHLPSKKSVRESMQEYSWQSYAKKILREIGYTA